MFLIIDLVLRIKLVPSKRADPWHDHTNTRPLFNAKRMTATYIVPVCSAHFERPGPFVAKAIEVSVADDILENITARPDPVTSTLVWLKTIRLVEVIPRT